MGKLGNCHELLHVFFWGGGAEFCWNFNISYFNFFFNPFLYWSLAFLLSYSFETIEIPFTVIVNCWAPYDFLLPSPDFRKAVWGRSLPSTATAVDIWCSCSPPGALRCQRRRLRRLRRPRPCRSSRAVSPCRSPCRSPLRSRCPSWCCCKICGLRWKEPWDLPWRRQISFEQNHDESTLTWWRIII